MQIHRFVRIVNVIGIFFLAIEYFLEKRTDSVSLKCLGIIMIACSRKKKLNEFNKNTYMWSKYQAFIV